VADPEPENPSVSPEKGIELLRQQLERFNDISDYSREFLVWINWIKLTRICMEKAFGKNHPNVEKFLKDSDDVYHAFRLARNLDVSEGEKDRHTQDERLQRTYARMIYEYIEELTQSILTASSPQ
jgi:hypothetical protein